MAQEMYKHDALLHLLETVADASPSKHDKWAANVSNAERDYFKKVKEAEGITLDYSEFCNKRIELIDKYGYDSILLEALKATNGCSRDWRTKAYGYMWRMAMESWDGQYYSDGDKRDVSKEERAIIDKAREYFGITDEEDDKCMSLTSI